MHKKATHYYPLQILAVAITAMACSVSHAQDEPEFRRWTDTLTGNTVHASFVAFEKGIVHLETKSGERVSISVDRLNARRRDYIADELERRSSKTVKSLFGRKIIEPSVQEVPQDETAKELFGVTWIPLKEANRTAKKEDKPIFWFRVLGDPEGLM